MQTAQRKHEREADTLDEEQGSASKRFKHWGGVLSVLESDCRDDTLVTEQYNAVAKLMTDLDATTTLKEVAAVLSARQYDNEDFVSSGPRIRTWWNSVNSPCLEELIRAHLGIQQPSLRFLDYGPEEIHLIKHCVRWNWTDAIEFLLERITGDEIVRYRLPVALVAYGTPSLDLFQRFFAKAGGRFLKGPIHEEILAQNNCPYDIACFVVDEAKEPNTTRAQFLHALQSKPSLVFLRFALHNELSISALIEQRRRYARDNFMIELFRLLVHHGTQIGFSDEAVDDLASLFLTGAVQHRQDDLVEHYLSLGWNLPFKNFNLAPAPWGSACAKHFLLVERKHPIQAFQDPLFVNGLFSRIVEDHTDYRDTLLHRWFARGFPLPDKPIRLLISFTVALSWMDIWPVCRFIFKHYNYKLTAEDMELITPRLSRRIASLLRREYKRQRSSQPATGSEDTDPLTTTASSQPSSD